MSGYYYVGAALPYLLFDESPRISRREFLEFLEDKLSIKDLQSVRQAAAGDFIPAKGKNRLFNNYREWEINVRNRLALLRAQARQEDGMKYLRESENIVETARVARTAFETADPLGAETALMRARWDYLSSLETGHQFDVEFLIIYALKLVILERKERLESERGAEVFTGLTRVMDETITQGV